MEKILISTLLLIITCGFTPTDQKLKTIENLPLQLSVNKGMNSKLVIYLTGDGGWNNFSQKLTQEFENKGYGVVSLNTRKYFWKSKTPDIFAQDIEYLVNYYMGDWQKNSVIIVGYSFGADVAAFLPERLSKKLLAKMNRIVLLSPSASSDFVINLSDLIGDSKNTRRKYKIEPELNRTTFPVICVFGMNEDLKLKNTLIKKKSLTIYELPGSHQYKNDTELLIKTIDL
jgi:type IV secretory pathway VirJ component